MEKKLIKYQNFESLFKNFENLLLDVNTMERNAIINVVKLTIVDFSYV